MVSQVVRGPSFNVSLWVSSLALSSARQKLQKLWKYQSLLSKRLVEVLFLPVMHNLHANVEYLRRSHIVHYSVKFLRQNTVVSTGICNWKFCVRVKDFTTDFSQRIQVVHTNFPSWPTENCLVWKWLDFCMSCESYISKLLTIDLFCLQHLTAPLD